MQERGIEPSIKGWVLTIVTAEVEVRFLQLHVLTHGLLDRCLPQPLLRIFMIIA